jgi:hypothetical protein
MENNLILLLNSFQWVNLKTFKILIQKKNIQTVENNLILLLNSFQLVNLEIFRLDSLFSSSLK